MLNITQILVIFLIIGAFAGIIYFVTNSFKTTCLTGYHFDKNYNSCVVDCPQGQVNIGGNGECGCQDPNRQLINGECVLTCAEGQSKCGDPGNEKCYYNLNQTCLSDNTLCLNSLTCGDNCCTNLTTCSEGNIVFLTDDNFTVTEGSQVYDLIIKKSLIGYTTNELEIYLQNLLNYKKDISKDNTITPTPSVPVGFTYSVKFDSNNKLTFTVTNNGNTLPSFNIKNMKYPENLGFKKFGDLSFSLDNSGNYLLKSDNSIDLYTCNSVPCSSNKTPCGDVCCNSDSCINNKICCSEEDNNEICDNGSCCPKDSTGNSNCCGNNCCDSKNNEVCMNGKCVVKCKYPDSNGNDIYCTPDTNSESGQYCINVTNSNPIVNNGQNYSYCGNNKCLFDTVNYDPANVTGPGYKDSEGLPVCKTSDGKLYSYIPQGGITDALSRTEYSPFYNKTVKNCSASDCDARLKEHGVLNVNVNQIENGCNATFDCNTVLETNPSTCPFGTMNPQCCYSSGDPNSFTGQVCPSGQIANLNSTTGKCDCIYGWGCFEGTNGNVCDVVTSDNLNNVTDSNIYGSLSGCMNSGKCNCKTGWSWDGITTPKSCNYYWCRDNANKPRPDMWTPTIINGKKYCAHIPPKVDANTSQYCHVNGFQCDRNCSKFENDAGPGYKLGCYYNLFNCQGYAADVTGANKYYNDPTLKEQIYYSNGIGSQLIGDGNYCPDSNNNKAPS